MSRIRQFFSEVGIELHKTTWPWDPKETGLKKFRELTDSTIVVVVATLLLGAFVNLWDLIMVGAMQLLIGSY
ncbi:MAG: preprotein translocase subunit SecE [Verrucomicrobiales bacterium]|nr:preprotein translocase subunit SecE [Verrucomicrobiales bacterium]